MSIDTLRRKVTDLLDVKQLQQHLTRWENRRFEANQSGDYIAYDECDKMVRLFEKRLERARGVEVQEASGK